MTGPPGSPVRLALAAAGLALLGACAGGSLGGGLGPYQRTAETWVGAPVSELRNAWGDWDGARDVGGGARQVIYSRSDMVGGVEVGCEARFTVAPSGAITRARVAGTVGGCRRLLGDAPARGR